MSSISSFKSLEEAIFLWNANKSPNKQLTPGSKLLKSLGKSLEIHFNSKTGYEIRQRSKTRAFKALFATPKSTLEPQQQKALEDVLKCYDLATKQLSDKASPEETFEINVAKMRAYFGPKCAYAYEVIMHPKSDKKAIEQLKPQMQSILELDFYAVQDKPADFDLFRKKCEELELAHWMSQKFGDEYAQVCESIMGSKLDEKELHALMPDLETLSRKEKLITAPPAGYSRFKRKTDELIREYYFQLQLKKTDDLNKNYNQLDAEIKRLDNEIAELQIEVVISREDVHKNAELKEKMAKLKKECQAKKKEYDALGVLIDEITSAQAIFRQYYAIILDAANFPARFDIFHGITERSFKKSWEYIFNSLSSFLKEKASSLSSNQKKQIEKCLNAFADALEFFPDPDGKNVKECATKMLKKLASLEKNDHMIFRGGAKNHVILFDCEPIIPGKSYKLHVINTGVQAYQMKAFSSKKHGIKFTSKDIVYNVTKEQLTPEFFEQLLYLSMRADSTEEILKYLESSLLTKGQSHEVGATRKMQFKGTCWARCMMAWLLSSLGKDLYAEFNVSLTERSIKTMEETAKNISSAALQCIMPWDKREQSLKTLLSIGSDQILPRRKKRLRVK